MTDSSNAPLAGIRVLDLSRILAGPMAAQTLADLGADVVKIENPDGGDDTRHWGPPYVETIDGSGDGVSAYFISANRGKRSIALDLATESGQEMVRQLVLKADVLIENFKVDGLKQYHLDYPSLAKLNPKLIYCSITGFGQSGPYKHRSGYDFMIQGMSGLMSITGKPDHEAGGEPMRAGVAVSDLFAGMHAVIGILAALNRRHRTQCGEHIDISLLDVQVAMLANQASNYLNGDQVPGRIGNTHPNIVPYQVFHAKDQAFILAVGNDRQFARCCTIIEHPELAADERFTSNSHRVRHREELVALMSTIFATRNAHEWLGLMDQAGIPAGPINSIDQVFENPQVRARKLNVPMSSTYAKNIRGVAFPIRMDNLPQTIKRGPPALNEHAKDVINDWLGKPLNTFND